MHPGKLDATSGRVGIGLRGVVVAAPFGVKRGGTTLKLASVKIADKVFAISTPEHPGLIIFVAVDRKFENIRTF